MIATAPEFPRERRRRAARRQWSNPLARARLLAGQLVAAERRRVDRLVTDHLHLLDLAAAHWANRCPGLDRDDARQAAYFGLRRAAELWDPLHPSAATFRTFAFHQLRAAIQQALPSIAGGPIRLPHRPAFARPVVASLGEDGSAPEPEDGGAPDPFDVACQHELRERVRAALGQLRPRDALVAGLRFGINGAGRPHTLAEIAARLGVSGERARQLELRALGELRGLLAE